MRNQLRQRVLVSLTGLLITIPTTVLAQGGSRASAKLPSYVVTIAVDFVDVAADYQKAIKVVPRRSNDNAFLLDALVRHGAKETRIPKAQTAEGVQVVSHVITSIPFTTTEKGQTQHNFMNLDSFMQATPRSDSDDTINVLLQVQRASLISDGPPPQSATATLSKTMTFHDGQTRVLGGRETTKNSAYHLIFVTVQRLKSSSG